MKNALLLFITILSFQFVNAQQREIDSLEQILSKIEVDSLKRQKSVEFINFYRHRDSEVHLYVLTKLLNKSIEDGNESLQSKWIKEKALYHRIQGNIDSSLVFSKKALEIGEKLQNFELIIDAKTSLSSAYQSKGDYTKAIELSLEMLKDHEDQGKEDEKNYLITKYNLSGAYYAIEEYRKSLDLVESLYNNPKVKEDDEFLSEVCLQIAAVKYQLDETDDAITYAKHAESIEKRPYLKAMIYSVLGSLYNEKGDHEKTNEYLKKSLPVFEDMGDQTRIIATMQNIGNNSMFLGEYDLAVQQLKEVEIMLSKEKHPNLANLEVNFRVLSEVYEKKLDYKNALYYSNKETIVRDSVLGIEKKKAISDIEIKYDTEKTRREKETAEQQVVITKLESQKNKNLFIGSITIAGLLLLASVFYFSRLKAEKNAELVTIELRETQKRLAIEKQYKDSELKALKAQMNPHFIFNALNSIQDYIVLNQKNLASDYLGKFADLIRNYLHFSDTGFISIPDEVHNLNLYLELEKLRFEEQLEYTFEVTDAANSEMMKIPTMLIQPYIENALKHGLLHKKDNRKLSVSISKFSNKIVECVIEDNGIGREKSKEINQKRESQHKSFALKATTERLDLLNYGRDKKIGVEFIDLKENDIATGTKVMLKIPILKK
ncbi:tetratricopeptide repeat-containing sensor histidine kinase [Psychroserpens jangbogonensis]|uniref:tetratricopeptide repeat-containing sensor histidine kinase n=1 Tax=Psychroserpens jangbogonensis TaxID=1484460 RepID=UPI00053EBF24|nr:histidine kinase [Psychroserpens jangbogonensis]